MTIAKIPGGDSAAEHRPIILLGVLHQARILLRVEALVLGPWLIAGPNGVPAPLHVEELLHRVVFAGGGEAEARRVAVGLAVLSELVEARVAVAGATCALGINLVEVRQNRLDGAEQRVEVES